MLVFLISGIAFIPYTYNSIYDILASSIRPFDLGLISALAACLILFYYLAPKKQLPQTKTKKTSTYSLFIVIFSFLFIICIQFFYFKKITLNEFFLSAFWITIPLFCYLHSKVMTKYLSIYIYLIWIANLAVCYFLPGEKVGIAGNRNWNAALMIICACFSIYQTYNWIQSLLFIRRKPCVSTNKKVNKKLSYTIIFMLMLITLCLLSYSAYIFYKCESRGAVLSGIITALLFVYLLSINHLKNKYKRKLKLILCFVLFSLLLLSLIILFIQITSVNQQISKSTNQQILTSLRNDVRIPLWEGTLKLIKDYPVLGTNPSAFESVFASYRPLDYFTKPTNTIRSNHPHNTLLYIGAVFGIPGLILWCFLWIYPIVYCFFHYSKLSTIKQLVFYVYIFLFLHGLLDLVLFHWPTVYLAAIFLGLLWEETFKNAELRTLNSEQSINHSQLTTHNSQLTTHNSQLTTHNSQLTTHNSQLTTHHSQLTTRYSLLATKSLLIITATIIFFYIIHGAYINYKSKYFFETGNYYNKQKKDFRALYQYQKGLKLKPIPKYLYKTAVTAITSLNNPELALYFFNFFNYITQFDYAHKNGFIALSLLKTGNISETIPFLIKEVVNYPLSAGAWYRLYLIQKQLKMYDAADFSLKNTYRALEAKNLPKRALPILLDKPEYDNHPERIPKKIINEFRQSSLESPIYLDK